MVEKLVCGRCRTGEDGECRCYLFWVVKDLVLSRGLKSFCFVPSSLDCRWVELVWGFGSVMQLHLGLPSALYVNGKVIHTKAIFCVDFSLENIVFQSTALYLWAGRDLPQKAQPHGSSEREAMLGTPPGTLTLGTTAQPLCPGDFSPLRALALLKTEMSIKPLR